MSFEVPGASCLGARHSMSSRNRTHGAWLCQQQTVSRTSLTSFSTQPNSVHNSKHSDRTRGAWLCQQQRETHAWNTNTVTLLQLQYTAQFGTQFTQDKTQWQDTWGLTLSTANSLSDITNKAWKTQLQHTAQLSTQFTQVKAQWQDAWGLTLSTANSLLDITNKAWKIHVWNTNTVTLLQLQYTIHTSQNTMTGCMGPDCQQQRVCLTSLTKHRKHVPGTPHSDTPSGFSTQHNSVHSSPKTKHNDSIKMLQRMKMQCLSMTPLQRSSSSMYSSDMTKFNAG